MAITPLMGMIQAGTAIVKMNGSMANGAEIADPPTVGMTKATAEARYGQPKSKTATPAGEVWDYSSKTLAGLGGKSRKLTFNSRGRVTDYSWQ